MAYMKTGVGELVPASYPVPQNPVKAGMLVRMPAEGNALARSIATVNSMSGCGTCSGLGGLGELGGVSDILSSITGPIGEWFGTLDWKKVAIIAGVGVLIIMLASRKGKSEYQHQKRVLQAEYGKKLEQLRSAHPRGYQRVRRGLAAAA